MIQSMTAFAQEIVKTKSGKFIWEIRSVNNKYLEVNFRIPEQWRSLEIELRDNLRKEFTRGKLDCQLRIEQDGHEHTSFELNMSLIEQISTACNKIAEHTFNAAPISLTEVLKWPGVIVNSVVGDDIKQELMQGFSSVLLQLKDMRAQEGETLAKILESKLEQLTKLLDDLQQKLPAIRDEQCDNLTNKVTQLKLDADNTRLEQEISYMLQKFDLSEEVDRLHAHIMAAKKSLSIGGVVGKRLDFIIQEMHREANTIASKANNKVIANIAIEQKVLIEQLREQVQNIE